MSPFARVLRATTDIPVPASVVWARLVDRDTWSDWSHFVPGPRGALRVGEPMVVQFSVRGRRLNGPAVLTRVEPERSLWWRGGPGMGLLSVEHGFDLQALPDGSTRLQHEERFTGLVAGAVVTLLGADDHRYRRVNEALARCVIQEFEASCKSDPSVSLDG